MAKKTRARRKPKARQVSTAIALRRANDQIEALRSQSEPGVLGVFARLARDPDLTVDKLGELVKLQERIEDRNAAALFDAAYRRMMPELPRIKKRGAIRNKAKEIQSRYSKYEDIRKVVDPIMRSFGFTFHSRTEWVDSLTAEIVGVLEHEAGGRRESRFRSRADDTGGKNAVQGLGSVVSYGKRYTLKDLLSIIEEGEDDDGAGAGKAERPPASTTTRQEAPAGFDTGSKEPITDGQLRRFHAIVSRCGRGELEVKSWLDARWGWTSSRQITRDKYDQVCQAIEAPGPLA